MTPAINANAYQYLLSLLADSVKVTNLTVQGRWLRAQLSSGVVFMVRNKDLDRS